MKPGAPRIVAGATLTSLLVLGLVSDVVVLLVESAGSATTTMWGGTIAGAAVALVLLALSVRLLKSGLHQRRAWWTDEALASLPAPRSRTATL